MSLESRCSDDVGVLYCHETDPNSLKLLLFVLETGLLPKVKEVIPINKNLQESSERDLLDKYPLRHDTKSSISNVQSEYGIFPVCICSCDDSMVYGADRIIKFLMDNFLKESEVDWSRMTVFNFFSCGMKMEIDMLKVENKQYTKTLINYEQLQADFAALQLQVKPNFLNMFAQELSIGNGFKKLQLRNQATESELDKSLDRLSSQALRNHELEEEIYILKKDNMNLLKEKNELRLMQDDVVKQKQGELEEVSLKLEQQNVELQGMRDAINDLNRLILKDINSSHTDVEQASHTAEGCKVDIEDVKCTLIKTSTIVTQLENKLAERDAEIDGLKLRNSKLESQLEALEASLRE